jgi:hypothetical protein
MTSCCKAFPRKQFGKIKVSSGVDVIITNLCDFRQFSAKNWRFSQETNVMIIFFVIYLALF